MPSGVIKKLSAEDRSFYTSEDVQRLLGVSRDKAYRMIREMRADLIAEGELHRTYPPGKVPKAFFNKMCML